MSEYKWEYCELWLYRAKEHKPNLLGTDNRKGWSYNCTIRYCAPTGQLIYKSVAELDSLLPYNPFAKAMGMLGGMGWELVSVQYGNRYGGEILYQVDAIIWDNRVAYFKRPVAPGRAVDDPTLELGT